MPLFDTQYEVDRDPAHMSYEAIFDTGEALMICPHLCDSHESKESDHSPDHRGLIDCTILTRVPAPGPLGAAGFEVRVPVGWVMDLDMASALIEGLSEVAPWVQLNSETDLEAYDPNNNPRLNIDVETDHHDLEEE